MCDSAKLKSDNHLPTVHYSSSSNNLLAIDSLKSTKLKNLSTVKLRVTTEVHVVWPFFTKTTFCKVESFSETKSFLTCDLKLTIFAGKGIFLYHFRYDDTTKLNIGFVISLVYCERWYLFSQAHNLKRIWWFLLATIRMLV